MCTKIDTRAGIKCIVVVLRKGGIGEPVYSIIREVIFSNLVIAGTAPSSSPGGGGLFNSITNHGKPSRLISLLASYSISFQRLLCHSLLRSVILFNCSYVKELFINTLLHQTKKLQDSGVNIIDY
jgi:hypothetical protein